MIRLYNHGFHMVFANGNTASVMFGPNNYAEIDRADRSSALVSSYSVEVAVWDSSGNYRKVDGFIDNDVGGYVDVNRLPEFLSKVCGNDLVKEIVNEA